jgi:hypothetical protein
MFTVNKNPTAGDVRKFAWAMLIGFGVIGGILWMSTAKRHNMALWRWTATPGQWVAMGLAALGSITCVVSLLSPSIGRAAYVGWMTATLPIGVAMSYVLLTILFFLLLPPFSLIVRWGDPLRRKLSREGTYWEDYRPHEPTLDRMARPF